MTTIEDARIQQLARAKGISRLCHFTPSVNFIYIARGEGLVSTVALAAEHRAEFHQQDLQRLDGYPDHICCSIEYPNAWYFRARESATKDELLLKDWVVLGIAPHHLWAPTTLFCQQNASKGHGRYVAGGARAFESLFDEIVDGSGGPYRRQPTRPPSCPTNEQAEVLVHRFIPIKDVIGIYVRTETQARREYVRLTQMNVPVSRIRLIVASAFFEPHVLRALLASGTRPSETLWRPDAVRTT